MPIYIRILILLLSLISTTCQANTSNVPIAENHLEATWLKLENSYKKGREGVPEILSELKQGLETPYALNNYSIIVTSIKYLHLLAEKGIFTNEELPILIATIKKQIHISDTFFDRRNHKNNYRCRCWI